MPRVAQYMAALVFTCGAMAQQSSIGSPLEDAWNLLANGQRDRAIQVLHEMIQKNPREFDARLLLGSILTEKGERAPALAELTEAVRLRPQSAEAQNALGEAYKTFGETKASREPFEKAVALDPGFAQARVSLGLALIEADEPKTAAEHLDAAIRIFGHTEDAAYPHYLRGKVYLAQNRIEDAVTQLREAISLRPDFAEAWSDLGQARQMLLDDAGARDAFERAVNLNPEDAVAQYRLGAQYLHQGKTHEAVDHLRASYRLNPDDQSTLNSLQLALREAGRAEEADEIKRTQSELLRKRDKANQNALIAVKLNNEGATLEKSANLAAALEKYQKALALYPEHVGIRVNLAVAMLRLGQWADGIAELREALHRDPQNISIKRALDDALAQAPPGTVTGNTKSR